MISWVLKRLVFVLLCAAAGFVVRPGVSAPATAALVAAAALAAEAATRGFSARSILATLAGGILGCLTALLFVYALRVTLGSSKTLVETLAFPEVYLNIIQLFFLAGMTYLGGQVGYHRLADLVRGNTLDLRSGAGNQREHPKILDTSTIIDGRIADICETGFVEGPLVVPKFVLIEMQLIADSHDQLKRTRGRRGFEMLERLKKSNVVVVISDSDYPTLREVDAKLMEFARDLHATIVTNDYNLNKVAKLRGIGILNINDLANALKPVVLPGEDMKVRIVKEGTEQSQGVAYLDDGTMVVVDNASDQIGKTVTILVTSVLQTAMGKMIFGRKEEQETAPRRNQRETRG